MALESLKQLSISDLGLEEFPEEVQFQAEDVESLEASSNRFSNLPSWFSVVFTSLTRLDLSRNCLDAIPQEVFYLRDLKVLELKNNLLTSSCFPKCLGFLPVGLEILNLNGNHLTTWPVQLSHLTALRELYLGGNTIQCISVDIARLSSLEVLHLGGNQLEYVPAEVGQLSHLTWLNLADNRLETLPTSLRELKALCALNLHDNRFQTLPQEIVQLGSLVELSLRNNPLVVHFVRDNSSQVPSLLELSGRSVITARVPFTEDDLPDHLITYLSTAHECVNPRCRGVYFTHHVEHVKFVDFCGKYRLPLMQYLCSPRCTSGSPSPDPPADDDNRVRRVLLG